MKKYARHLLFCTGGDCDGNSLLREARELLGKDSVKVKRSKVGCLGACKKGPIMIVYPDGVWYRCPNKKALKKIIRSHIKGGKVCKEHMLYQMSAAGD